jgi:thiamine biosynthesis lipoprotein ApbE
VSTSLGEARFAALGTEVVLLVTRGTELAAARAVLERGLDAVDRACSRFRDDSELTRVNEAAGRPVHVSPLLGEAVAVALRAARLTDGDVDPTIGDALVAWGYDRDFGTLDRETGVLRVPAGMCLDLGATAKAYAADRAARDVRAEIGGGVLVSLGGDIAVAGPAPRGGWPVLVTDAAVASGTPGSDLGSETVAIESGGLATSSTSVRQWLRADRPAHHIIDPATGEPADTCWRTVTAAAATCVDANIATTAAIVRGAPAARWLESLGIPGRLVHRDGRVVRVAGWPEPRR